MSRFILALSSLACLSAGVVGIAADPVRPVSPASGGLRGAAYSAAINCEVAASTLVARPRAAAFASALFPPTGPEAIAPDSDAPVLRISDTFEVLLYAPHRPIRARITIAHQGKPLAVRWADAIRTVLEGFDRDGDGTLNGFEVQYVFSDASLASLMQNGFYTPNPTRLPTLDKLDTNSDRRVSVNELAAYYRSAAAQAMRAFPPFAENPANAQATESLFKLFDADNDGKLMRPEVEAVEELLATRDVDEDECLTLGELTSSGNPFGSRFVADPIRDGQRPPPVPDNVVVYEREQIPGTVTQVLLKKYDKNGDLELSRIESGFDRPTFRRLDSDRDGKLGSEELDEWRTGEPDFEARLSLAPKAVDCKVEVTTGAKRLAARGFNVKPIETGRVIVSHGRQPLELWAYGAVLRNARASSVRQSYLAVFQQAAGSQDFVEEKNLLGTNAPQFQIIRVMLEPADFDSDGKLTKAEFNRYFDLQEAFSDLGLALSPAVQTPTLFQLLDENTDGRLGVRELRTAWSRLLPLEPVPPGAKTDVVTKAAIQPAVSIRVSRLLDRGTVQQPVNFTQGNPDQVRVPQKGPVWFRKMDRNGDGDVSRLEYLGTRAEFDSIDADKDDLMSLDEAEAFDAAVRKDKK